jgi:hypothetical protein
LDQWNAKKCRTFRDSWSHRKTNVKDANESLLDWQALPT